jgi:diadenylate cyclase
MLELFKISFLSVTILDVLDIVVVTAVLYFLYQAAKNTVAAQVFVAIIAMLTLYFIAEALHLRLLSLILRTLSGIWLLGFIVLFAPEIRRLLLLLVRSRLFGALARSQMSETIDEVVRAAVEMSERHIGALIVFTRSTNIKMTLETGIPMQARLTKELLLSIFNTKSPLHDGAVILQDATIEAARCILPLSQTTRYKGKHLGTRHRAAMGISEQADVLVLVVSEETGRISLLEEGEFIAGVNAASLEMILTQRLEGSGESGNKRLLELVEELKANNLSTLDK